MKRTPAINFFISIMLGVTIGTCLTLAREKSSILYGILTIFAVIACFLNNFCEDSEEKDNKEKKE